MLRRYKGMDGAEEMQEHFVLLKWGQPYLPAAGSLRFCGESKTGTGVPCPY